jgi:hypothetical protein
MNTLYALDVDLYLGIPKFRLASGHADTPKSARP